MAHNTMSMDGKTFVLVPADEHARLTFGNRAAIYPPLPPADADGHFPALDAMMVMTARKIIDQRTSAGLSQKALAERAGVRPETLNRIEKGKSIPDTKTLAKIDRALKATTDAVPAIGSEPPTSRKGSPRRVTHRPSRSARQ
jgi:DNA-binding XRE family transcriptional regulator